jgi:hypothetical protein
MRKRFRELKKAFKDIPLVVIVFFSLIAIFSTVTLFRDLSTIGFKPFGYIQTIIAQAFTPDTFDTTIDASKIIFDQPQRCRAFNPRTGKPIKGLAGGSGLSDGKGGINQGGVGNPTSEMDFVQGNNSAGQDLNMGYAVSIFTGPSDLGPAVSFVKDANERGIMPVIRLCYVGDCEFTIPGPSIADFYKALTAQTLSSGYEYVGILGPNEPGTGGVGGAQEMTAFGVSEGGYSTLVSAANDTASALQGIRAVNGGNAYLSPVALNITNRLNDDVAAYIGGALKPELFDYMIGNSYDSGGVGAYEHYGLSGLRQYVEDNGLRLILSEFGTIEGTVDVLKQSFAKFCDDPYVDGIVFYRGFKDLPAPDPKPVQMETSEILEMTASCSKSRIWVDCNFDSLIYSTSANKVPLTTPDKSTARSIYKEADEDLGKEESLASLKVACVAMGECIDGEGCRTGTCEVNKKNTIKIQAPIKQFGSNSALGIKSKTFTPICASIAAALHAEKYDALNQFAAPLNIGTGEIDQYPMPWLGSAINCSSELIKYAYDYGRFTDLQDYPSPGSFVTNSQKDILADVLRDLEKENDDSECISKEIDGTDYIPDERTIIINGQNIDKCKLDLIKVAQDYYPYRTPAVYKFPPGENSSDMRYLSNQDEYIWGPEVLVDNEQIPIGNPSRMCFQYAGRDPDNLNRLGINFGPNGIDCKIRSAPIIEGFTCSQWLGGCDPGSGRCRTLFPTKDIEDQIAVNCFGYQPKDTDEITYRVDDYEDVPKLDIPDIYDSLYRMYQRIDNNLKESNLKLKVNNNIGWKFDAYSIIRDGNIKPDVSDAEKASYESWYKAKDEEKTYTDLDNLPEIGTATQPEIFNNDGAIAKGKGTSKASFYYDWLGYLDIFQEFWSVYTNNSVLPGEVKIINPLFQVAGAPNTEKEQILISGLASQVLSYPILTCDQYEVGRRYTNDELKAAGVNAEIADMIWPYDTKLDEDAKPTCITERDDDRFGNRLEEELCKRGYLIEGVCDIQCSSPTTTTPTGNIEGATCPIPTGHRCFQGATGSFTHCAESNLPLDFYPHFVGGSSDPARRDLRVVSPEAGTINTIADNGNQGTFIEIMGNSGILYKLQHMARSSIQVVVGDKVVSGQLLGNIATQATYPGLAYGNSDIHLHVSGFKDGQNIDPYYLYGELLGCNVRAPVGENGSPIPNGTIVGMDSGYCVTSADGKGALQDNACSKPAGLKGDELAAGIKSGSGTTVSGPVSAPSTYQCRPVNNLGPGGGDGSGGGVISCDIDITDTSAPSSFNALKPYLDIYGRAYNSDSNSSYTFVNDADMYNFVVNKAISLDINPQFAITLWLEETGASAVGSWGMGCIYFRDGRQTGRLDGLNRADRGAMQNHISEQLDCLQTYRNEFPNFLGFMCTYSGEVGRPNCTSFENNPNFPKSICRINGEMNAYL